MYTVFSWLQCGRECLQYAKQTLWYVYMDSWYMPYYLYINPRYLQPPTNEIQDETILLEPMVEVQEVNPVKMVVPTNPLADLPGLRWNQYSPCSLLINLKRAKRWLNSN